MEYRVQVETEYKIYNDKTLFEARLIRKEDNKLVFSNRTYHVDEVLILKDKEKNKVFKFKISTLKLENYIPIRWEDVVFDTTTFMDRNGRITI